MNDGVLFAVSAIVSWYPPTSVAGFAAQALVR